MTRKSGRPRRRSVTGAPAGWIHGFAVLWIAGSDCLADAPPAVSTKHLRVSLNPDVPAFAELGVDSLGGGRFLANPEFAPPEAGSGWRVRSRGENTWTYSLEIDGRAQDLWQVEIRARAIALRSRYADGFPAADFELWFDQKANHATLLALPRDSRGDMSLPAVLHLPDQGSLRITGNGRGLEFDSRRRQPREPANHVRVGFPAATAENAEIEYVLETAAIHPDLARLAGDPLYDGFRRNFLNIFQWQPRLRTLANNSSSDVCGFVLYEYAEAAARAPELAPGLRAMDLIRLSVDRVLDGGLTYGQPGYKPTAEFPEAAPWSGPHESLDHAPSVLWSACRDVEATGDRDWAARRYPQLVALAERMLTRDRDGDGLIEYEASGNSGSSPGKARARPANWWDTINFGHEDAYSNAIAYRALRMMSALSASLGNTADAGRFASAAGALKNSYTEQLFNPESGLIAGWKSADGKLHDYAFTFVNGMAVCVGLLEGDDAEKLMRALVKRMEAVGYDRFDLGLPGNLVPVRKEDYVDHEPRFGGGRVADGSDGFQTYINGGATACHSYWTIRALYQVGMTDEARRILHPLLGSFGDGLFQGVDERGKSRDWKDWSGRANGYEGFLVDGYLALLAVEDDLVRGR